MKPVDILRLAHWSMGITFSLGGFILILIYGTRIPLGIPVTVFLHILFVLLATGFKVSYVARLAALKQLGRDAH